MRSCEQQLAELAIFSVCGLCFHSLTEGTDLYLSDRTESQWRLPRHVYAACWACFTYLQWRLDRSGLLHCLAKVSRAPRGAHRPALPSRCCRPGSLASCGSLESCLCSHARHPGEAASGLCWTFGATSRICWVGCPLGQPVTASVSCCLHQLLLPRTRHCADGGRRGRRRLYWDPRSCILLVDFLLANIVTVRALVPKCMWYEDVVRISIGHDNTQSFMGHLLGSSNGGCVAASSLAQVGDVA